MKISEESVRWALKSLLFLTRVRKGGGLPPSLISHYLHGFSSVSPSSTRNLLESSSSESLWHGSYEYDRLGFCGCSRYQQISTFTTSSSSGSSQTADNHFFHVVSIHQTLMTFIKFDWIGQSIRHQSQCFHRFLRLLFLLRHYSSSISRRFLQSSLLM